MTVVFDTTVLVAHLRGEVRATELLLATAPGDRLVSVLTRVEVEGGMRSAERADVASLFARMRMIPVTDVVAASAGRFLRTYRRSHQGIDIVDYVIAATAEVHDGRLATLNVKHFPMFRGLQPPW